MEFIIIATLTTTLAVYSWWAGYKLGQHKGQADNNDRHV